MSQKIESMSDVDVLGLLVGSRHAGHLLRDMRGSLSRLLHEPLPAAYASPLIAAKLQAARELVRRALTEAMAQREVLSCPEVVRAFLQLTLASNDHEIFLALFLDAQSRLIATEALFRGTLAQTSVYPREVVKRTLVHNAASVIFAHNHPSGVGEPSRADELMTRTLREALALIDVQVLDHFIVAGNEVVSFAERGLL